VRAVMRDAKRLTGRRSIVCWTHPESMSITLTRLWCCRLDSSFQSTNSVNWSTDPTRSTARSVPSASVKTWRSCRYFWRRSSVVTISVFGRRTFPAFCPICGWQVTTLWVNCPRWVRKLGQLNSRSVN